MSRNSTSFAEYGGILTELALTLPIFLGCLWGLLGIVLSSQEYFDIYYGARAGLREGASIGSSEINLSSVGVGSVNLNANLILHDIISWKQQGGDPSASLQKLLFNRSDISLSSALSYYNTISFKAFSSLGNNPLQQIPLQYAYSVAAINQRLKSSISNLKYPGTNTSLSQDATNAMGNELPGTLSIRFLDPFCSSFSQPPIKNTDTNYSSYYGTSSPCKGVGFLTGRGKTNDSSQKPCTPMSGGSSYLGKTSMACSFDPNEIPIGVVRAMILFKTTSKIMQTAQSLLSIYSGTTGNVASLPGTRTVTCVPDPSGVVSGPSGNSSLFSVTVGTDVIALCLSGGTNIVETQQL